MRERKTPESLDCGVAIASKVLGGKWKACIIDAINRGITRPSELHRNIPDAPGRVINMHLKELEDYQIICKKIYPGYPLKVEYFLTTTGESILPIIDAMEQWGNRHREPIARISKELEAATYDAYTNS